MLHQQFRCVTSQKIARVENVLTAKSFSQLYACTGHARKHVTFIILFIIFCHWMKLKFISITSNPLVLNVTEFSLFIHDINELWNLRTIKNINKNIKSSHSIKKYFKHLIQWNLKNNTTILSILQDTSDETRFFTQFYL